MLIQMIKIMFMPNDLESLVLSSVCEINVIGKCYLNPCFLVVCCMFLFRYNYAVIVYGYSDPILVRDILGFKKLILLCTGTMQPKHTFPTLYQLYIYSGPSGWMAELVWETLFRCLEFRPSVLDAFGVSITVAPLRFWSTL